MKLPQPFAKLPVEFDSVRLWHEVQALPPEAWVSHPNSFPGNTAARLISVEGAATDEVVGRMAMTEYLHACPYIQQVLAQFGVVWGRSRLMRLAPGARVPEHSDMNYHWFSRVRVHIPVFTRPGVSFHCGDETVYMAPGEAWIFDNWRLHRVENSTMEERVHLVADTSGSAAFWNMISSARNGASSHYVRYQAGQRVSLALEQFNNFRVMPPSEVESLLGDLSSDLQLIAERPGGIADLQQFQNLLRSFCYDWRQLWLLYGDSDEGMAQFRHMSQVLREVTKPYGEKLCMRSNKLPAMRVLDARVVRYLVNDQQAALASVQQADISEAASPASAVRNTPPDDTDPVRGTRELRLDDSPVFIVSAPRSGSTLLFETLACTPQLWTVGGEAHWLVEGFEHLVPGVTGIEDNRVDARYATPELAVELKQRLMARLRGPAGETLTSGVGSVRFLEKTPKNALRIPFFAKIFPGARFIFLWRDPRENLSSIMEAWRSGGWVTYSGMPGWDGDWSLLLPPGWKALQGRPLPEVAAFQWESTNRIVLDDLAQLPTDQWMPVNYADLVSNTSDTVKKICDFAGIDFDAPLRARVSAPLPPSRHTLTKPAVGKWRKNEALIEPQLMTLQPTWDRLRGLAPAHGH